MGITQIIDPFYRRLDTATFRRNYETGQIVWAPVPHDVAIPRIMEVERLQPTEHFASAFHVRQMSDQHFKKRKKLPIKKLDLGDTEELLLMASKLRPSILLRSRSRRFQDISDDLRKAGKKRFEEEKVGLIPAYSVNDADGYLRFPGVMIARVKALMYNQLFYLPRKGSGLPHDSVLRLDAMIFVRPIHPVVQPTQYALSHEALIVLLGLLRIMLRLDMTPSEYDDFRAFRDLALRPFQRRTDLLERSAESQLFRLA